jgi:hypothetical protein
MYHEWIMDRLQNWKIQSHQHQCTISFIWNIFLIRIQHSSNVNSFTWLPSTTALESSLIFYSLYTKEQTTGVNMYRRHLNGSLFYFLNNLSIQREVTSEPSWTIIIKVVSFEIKKIYIMNNNNWKRVRPRYIIFRGGAI